MNSNKFEIINDKKSNVIKLKPKIGRNDLCYCGSGKKYKNCCMKKDQEEARIKDALKQHEVVSDKYFTKKEYIELSGYPVTYFDFFLLELLNITDSTLYKFNKTSNEENKKIIKELYRYSKKFFGDCIKCNNCIRNLEKGVSFSSLIKKGLIVSELPANLQKNTGTNFFYIEFFNAFACKLEEETCKLIDKETARKISEIINSEITDYAADNCAENCDNECLIKYKENAYCKFCTFGSNRLPCPKNGEISYEVIKASESDMEH